MNPGAISCEEKELKALRRFWEVNRHKLTTINNEKTQVLIFCFKGDVWSGLNVVFFLKEEGI